jgi:hypothetical protein
MQQRIPLMLQHQNRSKFESSGCTATIGIRIRPRGDALVDASTLRLACVLIVRTLARLIFNGLNDLHAEAGRLDAHIRRCRSTGRWAVRLEIPRP